MWNIKRNGKLCIYLLFSMCVLWIVIEPKIPLSAEDGTLLVLFAILVHSWIEKKYLLKKLSIKFENQTELITNLFRHCPDLIYHKDTQLRYRNCNAVMKKALNLKEGQSIADKTDFDFLPKEAADIIRKYDKSVIENGQVVSYKIENKNENGETKIYDNLLTPLQENDEITGVLGIVRDVTQMEHLKEKILIQNAQLNSILDNIPFMIYLKDLDGNFITGNKLVEEALGQKKENMVGRKPQDIYLSNYADEIKAEDAIVVNEKKNVFVDKQVDSIRGIIEWYRVIKSPIIDSNNDVIGIIVVVKNIDEEKELESQKETLVATLTHDLKTPTNAQMTAMKLLLSESLGTLNKDQKEMIQQILNSNIYMSNMISTILATYKADNSEKKLHYSEFDFFELVNSTCKEISNLAMTKNQNLILKSELQNNTIFADELQLKRAVMNLISNAITYGYENTDIEIEIKDKDDMLRCTIISKSKYIPPEKMQEIFEKFKTSAGAKFNKASTSLGLYLSKKIVNAHNGEMHADSKINEICNFGFSIPKSPKICPVESK